jgi:hypothetical protein
MPKKPKIQRLLHSYSTHNKPVKMLVTAYFGSLRNFKNVSLLYITVAYNCVAYNLKCKCSFKAEKELRLISKLLHLSNKKIKKFSLLLIKWKSQNLNKRSVLILYILKTLKIQWKQLFCAWPWRSSPHRYKSQVKLGSIWLVY